MARPEEMQKVQPDETVEPHAGHRQNSNDMGSTELYVFRCIVPFDPQYPVRASCLAPIYIYRSLSTIRFRMGDTSAWILCTNTFPRMDTWMAIGPMQKRSTEA